MARLGAETFDVAIIGGGINGAAVARDAAMRGLSVAIVEAGDFAGATSSRSSKLIHGGLRYLPQGQLRLVYHALRERERLRHLTAPHLVSALQFLFPFYRGRAPGRLAISSGLIFYDLFAMTPRPERHRRLGVDAVRAIEPALATDGLRGGAQFIDGWGDDARLTLENLIDAAAHRAAAANYVAVEGFERSGGRIAAAGLRDLVGGATIELRARHFVNATGPWLDDLRRLDDPDIAPGVRLTKGVHLVISSARMPVRNPLVLTDGAGRIVFVMPHGKAVLVGTTDTDFAGERRAVAADRADLDYLLAVVNRALPALGLVPDDVEASFAGLRALPLAAGGRAPSAVSREEMIVESRTGLLSIAGGKLTTHRRIAEQIVDRIVARLGRTASACSTRVTPLPGARPGIDDRGMQFVQLPEEVRASLSGRYGTRAAIVARLAGERAEWASAIAPGCAVIGAEVIHAMRHEFAVSLSDLIVRRLGLIWRDPVAARAIAAGAARMMAAEDGWLRERTDAEVSAFLAGAGFHDRDRLRARAAVESLRP
ncbi:MAG: glycerol-3-phosphate dehydrogenase/oxidase [Candidatus Binataceae bacterium]|nr:glycerol-3-phosphate dehydrogenase/oxidase [Candidatus Binataceae bacterium]